MVRVWINEVDFSDGSTVSFDKSDIVVFVGPNNSGKSASLKEMAGLLNQKTERNKTIKRISIRREGNEQEIIEFVKSVSSEEVRNNRELFYTGYRYAIWHGHLKSDWMNQTGELGDLAFVLSNILTTETRLTAANPAPNIRLTSEPLKHPIHFLQKYDEIEQRFSEYFRETFGLDLIIHRNAGNQVPLYVGIRPVIKPGEDRISQGYLRELEKLDLLHEQGDGMRAFVGVLLDAFISNYSIIFVDEPEAFLHPPQARLLGKMLARDLPSERQVFVATHSEDFLKGVLDADVSNLKIIRMEREGLINRVHLLNDADIRNG